MSRDQIAGQNHGINIANKLMSRCCGWREDGGSKILRKLVSTTSLRGVTTQETSSWIFAAVRTSNLAA